jgi:hypothetical protein
LELREGFRDFLFILLQSSFYIFLIFDFVTYSDGKQQHVVEKEQIKIWWMKGREMQLVEEGWKIKYEITTGLFS